MHVLDIDLRPSKLFALLLIVISIGSLIIVALSIFTLANKILLSLLVILYTLLIAYREFWKHVSIRIIADSNGWRIGKNSQLSPIKILGESTVTRWGCVIRYKVENSFFTKTCLVFRDSVGQDEFRQLLVALRYK